LITVQYAAFQQLGVVFGFFFNYGVTKHYANTSIQWQLPTSLQLLPALLWGIGSIFILESPRWLLSSNKRAEAVTNLTKLRRLPVDHPYVASELAAIEGQIIHEAEVTSSTSQFGLVKETFATPQNRRRFFLMFFCHTFSQWSGANAITQYSPTIFGYVSVVSS